MEGRWRRSSPRKVSGTFLLLCASWTGRSLRLHLRRRRRRRRRHRRTKTRSAPHTSALSLWLHLSHHEASFGSVIGAGSGGGGAGGPRPRGRGGGTDVRAGGGDQRHGRSSGPPIARRRRTPLGRRRPIRRSRQAPRAHALVLGQDESPRSLRATVRAPAVTRTHPRCTRPQHASNAFI